MSRFGTSQKSGVVPVRCSLSGRGALLAVIIEPESRSAAAVAGDALGFDDGPYIMLKIDRAPAFGWKEELQRRLRHGLREAVLGHQFGVFVAADASARLVVFNPYPATSG
jgi:hypothetical protein